jgi:twitching motility protein PilT
VIVQALVPRKDDPSRSTVVCEVLLRSPAISAIIARDAFPQVPGEIQNSRKLGMWAFDDSLADAVAKNRVTLQDARDYANDPDRLEQHVWGSQ